MNRTEEMGMLRDISKIARSLERIARVFEREEREKLRGVSEDVNSNTQDKGEKL